MFRDASIPPSAALRTMTVSDFVLIFGADDGQQHERPDLIETMASVNADRTDKGQRPYIPAWLPKMLQPTTPIGRKDSRETPTADERGVQRHGR